MRHNIRFPATLLPLLVLAPAVSLGLMEGMQMPSPPGTASIDLGGKTVTITYGRPSKRGRPIMGSLVPYGEVWRTGANEATQMTTPVDLTIGSLHVPAGKYSLYSLPGKDSWKLIVNKQTGQWGTQYSEGEDLGRADMKVDKTPAPVEQFTIEWEKKASGSADLVLEWENVRARVPVSASAK